MMGSVMMGSVMMPLMEFSVNNPLIVVDNPLIVVDNPLTEIAVISAISIGIGAILVIGGYSIYTRPESAGK
jgi:hypothetical protein